MGDDFVVDHTPAEHRTAGRRAEQATAAFRENYAIRGGGESVNSGLKQRTGMARLRVRGSPRVRMAVLLRCAGWNLFRALSVFKKRGIAALAASRACFSLIRCSQWPKIRRLNPLNPFDGTGVAKTHRQPAVIQFLAAA